MPRIARAESVGGIYHVINRGNMQMQVFDDAEDYEYFLKLLREGLKKEAVELHAYCLMPNHFHLLLVSKAKGGLSRFMQWVMTSHVRYYHKKNKTSGHVWQGRYKSFMVQKESYYLSLLRYIEANALRAKLIEHAQNWPYGSLWERINQQRGLLDESLVVLPSDWSLHVNTPLRDETLNVVRNSVNRQSPLGEAEWMEKTAQTFGLSSTLNARGRPRKKKEDDLK
ncbi:MAG: transposase [Campylobacterales bacterium]|nr:transposase [Campylobacterales bacterium]